MLTEILRVYIGGCQQIYPSHTLAIRHMLSLSLTLDLYNWKAVKPLIYLDLEKY